MKLLVTLLYLSTVTATPPSKGPYATAQVTVKLEAPWSLDASDPEMVITYPSDQPVYPGGQFPLVVYAHGFLGGGFDIHGYHELFHQMASHGLVIAAPKSCSTGCKNPGGASQWTCAGLPLVEQCNGVQSAVWESYYSETIKAIDWWRHHSQPGMDAPYGNVDWTLGVGIAGHSMGGQSTVVASCEACAYKYGIVAAALHHPATGKLSGGGNIGSNISIPTAVFTSSGDHICSASSTRDTYMALNSTIPSNSSTFPRLYRNLQGSSHLEPVLFPPIENPLLATYTAAWFKVHQQRQRNGTYYDLLYSGEGDNTGDNQGEDQICKQGKMVECEVVGKPCMPTPCDCNLHNRHQQCH